MSSSTQNISGNRPTSPALIVLAWAIVLLPAGWGLRYTVGNALKLFSSPTAQISPTAPSPH